MRRLTTWAVRERVERLSWGPRRHLLSVAGVRRESDRRLRSGIVALTLLALVPGLLLLAEPTVPGQSTRGALQLALVLIAGFVGALVLIPWRHLPRNAFALHSLASGAALALLIGHTGGAASPFMWYGPWLIAFVALHYQVRIALPLTIAIALLLLPVTQTPATGTVLGWSAHIGILLGIVLSVAYMAAHERSLERHRREVQPDIALLRQQSDQLRYRDSELALIERISDPAHTTQERLALTVSGAPSVFSVDAACILVPDSRRHARVAAAVGGESCGTMSVAGTPLDFTSAELRVGYTVPDISADGRWSALRPSLPFRSARSLLVVPLVAAGDVQGGLILATLRDVRTFSAAEMRSARTIGHILGALLQATATAEREKGLVQGTALIARVVEALDDPNNVAEVAQRILAPLVTAFGLRVGLLHIVDADLAHLRMVGAFGLDEVEAAPFSQLAIEPDAMTFGVVRTGTAYFSEEGIPAPLASAARFAQLGVRSYAALPLMTRGHVVGMLSLLGDGHRGYSADERVILRAAASTAARAMETTRLNATARRGAVETIEALAGAIEARDGYTSEHCSRMVERATALAEALGLTEEEIETVRLGALLHDVGKIGIPDAILHKPARLTPDEYDVMKRHPEIGARIAGAVEPLREVTPLILHHHERFDGTGYPSGLAREAIPIGARILAVVDAYGAMTEDRVYRAALSRGYALGEIGRGAGAHFDPHIARVFLDLLAVGESAPSPTSSLNVVHPPRRTIDLDRQAFTRARLERLERIGTLTPPDVMLAPDTPSNELMAVFDRDPGRSAVVLGEEGRPAAMVTRQALLTVLSSLYGNALFRARPAITVARGSTMLVLDSAMPPEEAARRATSRPVETRYDPLVITDGGRYLGMVAVSELLDYLNAEALRRARLSNPLSGLPGAPLLEAEVSERLATSQPLALVLADIDGFKAYNDHYGLARGDEVLLHVAQQLQAIVAEGSGRAFLGHVGGDDFIVLTTPDEAARMSGAIRTRFAALVPRFYDAEDLDNQGIPGHDRNGRERFYGLLSISAVAVNADDLAEPTYLTLTEQASQLKLAAKRQAPARATTAPAGAA